MKTLLILGAGTGGTMVANKMAARLDAEEWRIIIVDKDENHYYQPGFLFIPFGVYRPEDVVKPKRNLLPKRVEVIFGELELIEPDKNKVTLADKKTINYDYLVVATGSYIYPDETPGLRDGWHQEHFRFLYADRRSEIASVFGDMAGWEVRAQRDRNAHQVPRRAAGIHDACGLVFSEARDAQQSGTGLCHAAARRVHQTSLFHHAGGRLERQEYYRFP